MPAEHVTGASLAGWSRYFPGGEIHGADVDPRCMQQSESFTTHLVDQRDPASLERLGGGLDLVVDDGLHTPEANINVMAAFMPLLAPTGLLVIEDICAQFDTLWFWARKEMPSPYTMPYFPSSVMPQFRGAGGHGSIAVIARHQ